MKTYWKFWDVPNAVHRGKFVALNSYIREKEKCKMLIYTST